MFYLRPFSFHDSGRRWSARFCSIVCSSHVVVVQIELLQKLCRPTNLRQLGNALPPRKLISIPFALSVVRPTLQGHSFDTPIFGNFNLASSI